MNIKIPISWLHSHDYCEHQIYLEHVLGLKVEPTPEMIEGKEIHTILEEEHLKEAKLELTVEDAMKKSVKEKITLIGREIPVETDKIYGLIDEVHFTPNQIIVIDDKPNNYPFLSNKKQIWGYCLAFEQQFKPSLPLLGCLRNRDSKEIVWQELFSDKHRKIVEECVDRISGILNGCLKPEATDNINKCFSCKLNIFCGLYSKRKLVYV